MRLLIERHNRWTFESVRSLGQPLPNEKRLLTFTRLTCSSHKSTKKTSSASRPRPQTQDPSIFTVSNLPGGSELTVNWYLPNSGEPPSEIKAPLVDKHHSEPSRERSLRKRVGKMLSRQHHADQSNGIQGHCWDGTPAQELEAYSAPFELEEPRMAWELAANNVDTVTQTSRVFGQPTFQTYGLQTQDQRDLTRHRAANRAQNRAISSSSMIANGPRQSRTRSFPSNQYSSTGNASDVFPVQPTSRSFMHQCPPRMNGLAQQPFTAVNSNVASMSRSTSVTISPISPRLGGHGHHQMQYMRLSPPTQGPPSHTIASAHDKLSPHSSFVPSEGIGHFDQQLISPASTRRGSFVMSSDDFSADNPSRETEHRLPGIHEEFSTHNPHQLRLETSDVGSGLPFLHSTTGYISPASQTSTEGAVEPPQHLSSALSTPSRTETLIQQGHPSHLYDLGSMLQEQSGNYEPPPSYSAQNTLQTSSSWEGLAARLTHSEDHNVMAALPRDDGGRRPRRLSAPFGFAPTPLPCGQCNQTFSGLYRKANRKRHIGQKHSSTAEIYRCRDVNCKKRYQRDDARRKHEWKKHRIEASRPEKRRKDRGT